MTVSGSTTSSQDTPLTAKPIEEAPLRVYLEILRELGRKEDADLSEVFYVETLKQFGYDEETIYETSFGNLVKAVELIIGEAQKEVSSLSNVPVPISGNMLLGEGAEVLSKEQLQYIITRQLLLHEEEKGKQFVM